jgi:hypothetical protein
MMCVVLLPAAAFASGSVAFSMLAQTPIPLPIPGGQVVDHLADKSIAYWFLALAAIAIASWTWILKWMIAQLEGQRTANSEATTRLITYMERDHGQMIAAMTTTAETNKKVVEVMEKVADKLK